jgi:hypothetical protein
MCMQIIVLCQCDSLSCLPRFYSNMSSPLIVKGISVCEILRVLLCKYDHLVSKFSLIK